MESLLVLRKILALDLQRPLSDAMCSFGSLALQRCLFVKVLPLTHLFFTLFGFKFSFFRGALGPPSFNLLPLLL